ncbi:MAG: hypothetical protein DRJ08_06230 [Acidobacteria bacterium]|nr:MAG: hypothetical protein DRJ08_06230 [Acidobacteriota bacterium]
MVNSLVFLTPTRREKVEVKQKARLSPEGEKTGNGHLFDFSYPYPCGALRRMLDDRCWMLDDNQGKSKDREWSTPWFFLLQLLPPLLLTACNSLPAGCIGRDNRYNGMRCIV